MSVSKFAILVAGGSGTRMKNSIPKQFILLKGKPILMHTIEIFYTHDSTLSIIVVLPEAHVSTWASLCSKHKFDIDHTVVNGGKSRFQSVKNGLLSISATEGLVAIHDGVRPLTHQRIIADAYTSALKYGSGVAAVPLKETIREHCDGHYLGRDRENYKVVQTPQTFDLSLLKKAFLQEEEDFFTDDANVVEKYGQPIYLIEGDYDNIKITSPEDLPIADKIMENHKK